jgi:CheY-like chemotaxis protein
MVLRDSFAPPSRPLVLLVDDRLDTLALYAIALSGMGFDIIAAREADAAFTQASTHHPGVIVTEIHLGPAHGWDLLDRLKADARTRAIPVVVLTGDGQAVTAERARSAGAASFLTKPCLPDQLALTLRRVVSTAFAHVQVPTRQ